MQLFAQYSIVRTTPTGRTRIVVFMDYNAERPLEQAVDISAANAANRSAHSVAS
jgi:hypothetical protein